MRERKDARKMTTPGGGGLADSSSKERLHYLDTVKGITMLLVILGHCNMAETYTVTYTYLSTFRMPIFFMISGFLLAYKEERTGEKPRYELKKRARAYLVPFFSFGIIYTLMITAIDFVSEGFAAALARGGKLLLGLLGLNAPFAIWFLPCLLLTEILFIFERRILPARVPRIVLLSLNLILATAASFCHPAPDKAFPLVLLRPLVAIFFFSVGYAVCPLRGLARKKTKWVPALLAAGVVLHGVLFAIGYTKGYATIYEIAEFYLGGLPVFFFVEGTLASLLILTAAARYLPREIPFVTRFGRNTMAPLCIHMLVLEVLWIARGKILPIYPATGPLCAPLLFFWDMLLTLPADYLCERCFPFLLGKKILPKTQEG